MRKAILVVVVLAVLLVACGAGTPPEEVVDDQHVATFSYMCDTGRNIGMYTYAYHKDNGSQTATGYGYAVRMTDAEYEKECTKYEK